MRAAIILPVLFFITAFVTALPLGALQDPGLFIPMAALLAGGAILAATTIRVGRATMPMTATALSLLGLWGWMAIAMAASPVPFHSLIAFCTFSALPLAFFSITLSADRDRIVAGLLTALWGAGTLLALPAIVQGLTQRAHWPMLDPNILGTIFALVLPLAVARFFGVDKRAHRIVVLASCALLAAAIIATGSRGATIAAAIALAVLIGLNGRPALRQFRAPVAAIIIAVAGMATIVGTTQSTIFDRMATLNPAAADQGGLAPRILLNRGAIEMMADNPLFGTGPGTFFLAYPAHRDPVADTSLGVWTHCDPLQWGAEAGAPALLLFYAVLIGVLIRTLRAHRVATPDRRMDIAVPFTALLVIAVQAHIHFPLQIPAILIPCGILLAAWHCATARVAAGDTAITLPTWRERGAAGVLCTLVIGLFAAITLQISAPLYDMRAARNASSATEALTHMIRADRYGPDSFIDPEIALARMNIALLTAQKQSAAPERTIAETAALLDTASFWNPYWADIDALRGDFFMATGDRNTAQGHYARALKKDPAHFHARAALANLLMESGNKTDAAALLDHGLRMYHPDWYRQRTIEILKAHGMTQ